MIFNVPVIICEPWQMFAIWLPSYIMGRIAAKTVSSEIRNQRWSNIVDTVLFPYLMIPILLEALGVRKREFQVTEKRRAVNHESDAIMALPHMVLCALSVAAIIRSIGQMIEYESIGPAIILFWLVANLSSLVMAVFFMLGRTNKRMSERYQVSIPVCLDLQEKVYAKTCDVSEHGMAVLLEKPVDIPMSEPIGLRLHTSHYSASMQAKLVHVKEEEGAWKYSFQITELTEPDKGEYYQIVYDREPSLPNKIEKTDSVFEEVKVNLKKRGKNAQTKEERRKAGRILLGMYFEIETGEKILVEDYNFHYMLLVQEEGKANLPQTMKMYPNPANKQLFFDLEYEREISEKKLLYYIKNHDEIAFDKDLEEMVNTWIEK